MHRSPQIGLRLVMVWLAVSSLSLTHTTRSLAQTGPSKASGHTQPAPSDEQFAGCYELKLGRWWPWGFGSDDPYVTPPTRIQLLPEIGTRGFEQGELLIRSLPRRPGEAGSRESSFWVAQPKSRVMLVWTNGFSGVSVNLAKHGDKLSGWAHPHFDVPQFIPHIAHATARRFACATDGTSSTGANNPPNQAGREDQASSSAPTNWLRLDAVALSILAPPGWKFHQLVGADSYVGEFTGDGVTLTFDFGRYSNQLKKEKKPTYVVVHKSVGGFSAKIVSPRTPGHGITGIYFARTFGGNKLCVFGQDLGPRQQALALKIFETIRFGHTVPPVLPPPPPPPRSQSNGPATSTSPHVASTPS